MKNSTDIIKGKKYFLSGNLPASIQSFTAALEKEPGSPEILMGRGAAFLKLGKFDKAVHDLSIVLESDRDCERAFFLRGIAYLNDGEFERALADLNRALGYNETRSAAILARGFLLSSMGMHKEAEKDFTNSYVRDNIVIDEFLEEYAISEVLFKQAMELFNHDTGEWNLLLTEDEMAKMEITH